MHGDEMQDDADSSDADSSNEERRAWRWRMCPSSQTTTQRQVRACRCGSSKLILVSASQGGPQVGRSVGWFRPGIFGQKWVGRSGFLAGRLRRAGGGGATRPQSRPQKGVGRSGFAIAIFFAALRAAGVGRSGRHSQ